MVPLLDTVVASTSNAGSTPLLLRTPSMSSSSSGTHSNPVVYNDSDNDNLATSPPSPSSQSLGTPSSISTPNTEEAFGLSHSQIALAFDATEQFENLLSQLHNLSISKDSQFFIAINPHIAYPLNSQPPSPSDPVSGFLDPFSPTVPGAFAHSTPQCTLDRTTAPSPFSSPLTPLPSSAPSSPLPSLTALICPLDSPLRASLLPILTQPQPNITFPHISPSNANPPQTRNMAANPDIEILTEAAKINDKAAQIKAAIQYADLDEAEVWQTLTAASGGDWDAFVVAIKDLYLGCEGADRYCRADLQYLVQEYCTKAMHSQDELGEYHRKFMKISNMFFLDGFPRVIADQVCHRLSIIRAGLHSDDAYPMEDIMDAAKFLLTGAALRELLANLQEGCDHSQQQGSLSASRQPSGVVVKQKYSLQAQWAAQRHPGCTFCRNLTHYLSECEHVIAYLQAGKIIRGLNGRLCMPDGGPIPRVPGCNCMKESIDPEKHAGPDGLSCRPQVDGDPPILNDHEDWLDDFYSFSMTVLNDQGSSLPAVANLSLSLERTPPWVEPLIRTVTSRDIPTLFNPFPTHSDASRHIPTSPVHT
ncbi:hypothetical protein PAXINDRAFT_14457 [Paxillus involutus ATCC 200175]|uniref:Uncharacterized protein n=1 Tax=Paxillus involutus ATCC 200175 TaxID=664439 RepID=A0A0C9TZL4_PAXIN|nr:hypothetical protein PAXINDRAFT_14457 [Paxillus involutus ATCC 200175]